MGSINNMITSILLDDYIEVCDEDHKIYLKNFVSDFNDYESPHKVYDADFNCRRVIARSSTKNTKFFIKKHPENDWNFYIYAVVETNNSLMKTYFEIDDPVAWRRHKYGHK
jgi:hypothetical protein